MSRVFPRSEFSTGSIHQATVTVPCRAITDVALDCTVAITTTYLYFCTNTYRTAGAACDNANIFYCIISCYIAHSFWNKLSFTFLQYWYSNDCMLVPSYPIQYIIVRNILHFQKIEKGKPVFIRKCLSFYVTRTEFFPFTGNLPLRTCFFYVRRQSAAFAFIHHPKPLKSQSN